MRVRPIVLVLCVVALAVGACGSSDSSSKAVPELKDPTASARPLVTRLFELTQKKDASGLREFLSPAFQVERADGSGATKDAFLANLTTIRSFTLTDLAATQAGSTLIVRYLAQAEGLVNDKPYKPGPAPRLTVFHWNGKAWQVAAHANFNPLTG